MRGLAVAGLLGLFLISSAARSDVAQCRVFELSLIVDGSPLPEYPWRDRVYVEALRGRSFSLRVSNPTSERVAVAISVDGRNVIDAKRTTAQEATKWVLLPGQTIEIPGWQVSGEAARRFFFTETARSYARWLGDTSNVGAIEAVFFRERTSRPHPITSFPPPRDRDRQSSAPEWEEGAAGGVNGGVDGNARSEPESRKSAEAPRSGAPADRGDSFQPRPRTSDSYAATGIGERTSFPVERVDFQQDPHPAARIALRYEFRRELVRLGVLPGEEELYARERSRGFEPEYAPDPDRHRAQ
jgi:hypothetical protein